MSDFKQISNQARERLVAELHKTVATFGAAVDEAADVMLDAAEVETQRRAEAEARRAEQLAGTGLEPLRKLSAELLEKATELDREVKRLSELAADAASELRRRHIAETPGWSKPSPPATPPNPDPAPAPSKPPPAERQTPLDVIDEVRNSIAETPIDIAPRYRRFKPPAEPAESESKIGPRWTEVSAPSTDGEAKAAPTDGDVKVEAAPTDGEAKAEKSVPDGVRLVVEQMRIAGEPDSVIAEHLEDAGIEDPAGVLERVKLATS